MSAPPEIQPQTAVPKMQYRRFGKTGERLSVVTLGGMRFKHGWNFPRDRLPAESVRNAVETVRLAFDFGINHFETAHGYVKSEHLYGAAFKELGAPRDQIKVMTKGAPMTADETRKLVENQLRALQLDFVDFYGWHGINNAERLRAAVKSGGPVETLLRLREEGLVRHVGFSTHAPLEIILQALDTGLFSFVNLHYYYFFQRNLPAVERAGKLDVGVFIISPNEKGGMLWDPPETLRQTCLPLTPIQFNGKFCLSRPEIHTLSMGMHEPFHFQQNLKILEGGETFAPEEEAMIGARLDAQWAAVDQYCTVCHECLPCPEAINIPEILRFRNMREAFDMQAFGEFRYNMLDSQGHWFPGTFGSRCTECGDCLPRCPEKLEIPRLLRETHKNLFDRKAYLKNQVFDWAVLIYNALKNLIRPR